MEKSMPLGLRFSLLHRSFKKRMDRMLAEQDLTGVQFNVLGSLIHLEMEGREEISQRDLEAVTRLSHASTTEILKRLERKGFLRCEQSARDRRFKSIHATPLAYSLSSEVKRVEEDSNRWLCRGLSEEQMQQLIEITDRMLENACRECKRGSEGGHD